MHNLAVSSYDSSDPSTELRMLQIICRLVVSILSLSCLEILATLSQDEIEDAFHVLARVEGYFDPPLLRLGQA